MQQVERKAAIANDVGQLGIDQVSEFRAYLVACGFMARDGSGDQFFHVRRPDDQSRRWIPIERGRGGVPKTPGVLRKYLDAFLSAPASPFREAVVSSARLASVPGTALEFNVEVEKALSLVQVGQHMPDLPVIERWTNSRITDQGAIIRGDCQLCHTAVSDPAAQFKEQAEAPARAAMAEVAPFVVDSLASTAKAQYLSDLRDDLALHAPFNLPECFTQEQLERHIKCRWAYADLMIKHRTTKAGD